MIPLEEHGILLLTVSRILANGSRQLRSVSSSISRRSVKRDSEPVSLNSQSTGGPYSVGRSSSPSISNEPQSPTSSTNPRRSGDSPRSTMLHHHHSQSVGRRAAAGLPDRARSLSASTPKVLSVADFGAASPSSSRHGAITPMSQITATPTRPSHHHTHSQSRRTPIVYPALLSRVAEAFRTRITLTERVKDGLAYQDAFDGREAVDKIAYIIKTTDRNLALLLGRALDAQKFFHDVTYDHRLRDSPHEIYQFKARLPSPFVSEEMVSPNSTIQATPFSNPLSLNGDHPLSASSSQTSDISTPTSIASSLSALIRTPTAPKARRLSVASTDEAPLPSGVFTLLTDCYSPTCTRDALCYSIACPRRLEQQARLNMKPQPGLRRSLSNESLGDTPVREPVASSGKRMTDRAFAQRYERQGLCGYIPFLQRLPQVSRTKRRNDKRRSMR